MSNQKASGRVSVAELIALVKTALGMKYTKPSGGIPASDLASGVIPVVPQMATQANMSDWTSGKTVDALVLKGNFIYALQELSDRIPTKVSDLTNDSGFQTAAQVQTAIAAIPDELPTVTSTDNGKFLRVVSGEWTAETVPSAESNSFGGGS